MQTAATWENKHFPALSKVIPMGQSYPILRCFFPSQEFRLCALARFRRYRAIPSRRRIIRNLSTIRASKETYVLRAREVALVDRFVKTGIAISFRGQILEILRGRAARLLLSLLGVVDAVLVAGRGSQRRLRLTRRLVHERSPFAIERRREAGQKVATCNGGDRVVSRGDTRKRPRDLSIVKLMNGKYTQSTGYRLSRTLLSLA